jgi:hypothetical protein
MPNPVRMSPETTLQNPLLLEIGNEPWEYEETQLPKSILGQSDFLYSDFSKYIKLTPVIVIRNSNE